MSETESSSSAIEFNNPVDQRYFDKTGRTPPLFGREATVDDLLAAVEFARDQAMLTRNLDEAVQLREEAAYLEEKIIFTKHRLR